MSIARENLILQVELVTKYIQLMYKLLSKAFIC